jgi:SP family general alpha glucoside:H+ symporter-like MFS transporter
VPLVIAAFFAPESPWWLVKTGQNAKAAESLKRLSEPGYLSDEEIDGQIQLIAHTFELEKQELNGSTWLDIFRGSNLRRTEIVCVVWACQSWCGQPLTGYAAQL